MTLQLVRPDIRQSCILLAAVRSCASHKPAASIATAINSPAIAPRRFGLSWGSLMVSSVPILAAGRTYHYRLGRIRRNNSATLAGLDAPDRYNARKSVALAQTLRNTVCSGKARMRGVP